MYIYIHISTYVYVHAYTRVFNTIPRRLHRGSEHILLNHEGGFVEHFSYLWLARKEGMDKIMETTKIKTQMEDQVEGRDM